MSMVQSMAQAQQLAMRGYGTDDILAKGIKLNRDTVAAIVRRTRTEYEEAFKRADSIARQRRLAAAKEREAKTPPPITLEVEPKKPAKLKKGGIPSMRQIIGHVALQRGVLPLDITSGRRQRIITAARQEVMYLAYRHTKLSSNQIGRALSRDHTTVLHGIKVHAERNGLPLPGAV